MIMANNRDFSKRIQEHEQRLEQQRVKSKAARDHAEQALKRSHALRRKLKDEKQAAAHIVHEATGE